ncbi:BTAD domain-containing putative transcriptional regulator [Phytohabitans sp. ZYX-F-186]|uniref:BTAD domain-containing putative transcriptional regulator n=1 Tax=Phytohabitans maris TaxID=3071409 RepID=A0ABU0ZMH4_9ACTN|nr:BTAD domain-containing putative transcriptional regulator [Phytohabitans sp. ZYX-F-186]MDQ7908153.1 BTAD domain-containing putative transcriptional regulator [Phytohabitans sp. ZYX-F-186]
MGAGVRIQLLGGVAATAAGGEPVDVGPAKCRALLATLALAPGAAVPMWRLVELVWGNDPPRTAERTLQSYVTRLRAALGPGTIARTGAAYRLDLPGDAVDAARFQRRLDAGDVSGALAEWTGYPLAGLTAPGLAATVDGLVERWLGAVEADLVSRVEADPAATVGRLAELTADHPYREGLWALLMTALYRSGRQADALAAYRTARRHLVDGLGVEPGPELRKLEAEILDQRLDAPPPAGNLPLRPGRLIGRARELLAVRAALAAYPVVTLVGPGGIGKTRLALAAAREVVAGDGAWLVDLTEITSPADVPRAVAGALGVRESAGRSLRESIVATLRSRDALLLLDNCEHVVDGAAALARALAEGSPGVRVLATSREGLDVGYGHEMLVAVPPLDPAGAAVELFDERAAAAAPGYDATAYDRRDVEEICRRLDGVPLAIELAAARTTSLTPADLLARLDDHLGVLVGGRRTGAERHRTMRATIQWSYDLLGIPERALLRRLAVFAGPFDLAAAEAVGGPGVEAALGHLVARSMVLAEAGPFGRRFRLLETVRQFAAERLAEAGGTGPAATAHARWCRDRVAAVNRLLAGPSEVEGVARLDEHWPNLRAAFEWACASGDRDLGYALVRAVASEVPFRSRAEVGDWAERLLALAPERAPFALAVAAQRYKLSHDSAAYDRLAAGCGPPDHPAVRRARAAVHDDWAALTATDAVADLRREGDHDLAEHAEVDVGAALLFTGRFAEHDALVGRLAERYRVQGPPTLHNWTLMLLGYSAAAQGRHEAAERLFDAAVDVEVPPRTHSPNRTVEARVAFRRGDRPRAYRVLRTHVEDLLDSDNMQGACVASVEFVAMLARSGRLAEAEPVLAYLRGSGLLDSPVWRAQVEPVLPAPSPLAPLAEGAAALAEEAAALAEEAAALAEEAAALAEEAAALAEEAAALPGGAAREAPVELDDRGALEYMRAVLSRNR